MKCCLCSREIEVKAGGWDSGNNAEPVANGRCCDECNDSLVIPARLFEASARRYGVRVEMFPERMRWPAIRKRGYENREDTAGQTVALALKCADCGGASDDLEAALTYLDAKLTAAVDDRSGLIQAAEDDVTAALHGITERTEGGDR